jgi:hypothetical protein
VNVFTSIFLALCLVSLPQAERPGSPDQKDVLVIDGAKDPGQIPEWLAWEYSFTLINQWQGRDNGFTHDLREAVTPEEFALLEKEGTAHKARMARRASLGAKLVEKYPFETTTEPKVIERGNEEAFAIELEYRRDILAARDRLLQTFSVASQAVLLNWVAENKTAITSHVPKSDLKRYRLPE